MLSKKSAFMVVFSFLIICSMTSQAEIVPGTNSVFRTSLRYGYYDEICEDIESIVWSKMKKIVQLQHNAPAQLLRLMFHDCFIEGCDASVLLADRNENGTVEREAIPNRTLKGFNFIDVIKEEIEEACPGVVSCSDILVLATRDGIVLGCDASVLLADRNENGTVEREAIPNRTLKGFNFIDVIKEEIEEACPGVVSCSDILVLATRDGIVLAGGPYYPVLTGRRDSKESFFDKAMAEIPQPNGNISETLRLFSLRGFDERETVALLGGHNIGRIGCEFIQPRLSNFMGTGLPDPTIPPDFLEELKRKCPDKNNTINNMFHQHAARDLSESGTSIGGSFDNHYYKTLMRGRGLLFADQQLMANEKTAAAVTDFGLDDGTIFRIEFAHAMAKMSNIGVLTGYKGEVRRSCSHLNSDQ